MPKQYTKTSTCRAEDLREGDVFRSREGRQNERSWARVADVAVRDHSVVIFTSPDRTHFYTLPRLAIVDVQVSFNA